MSKTTRLLLIGGLVLAALAAGGKQMLSGNMSILQLWNLAKNAGFAGADLVIAVAVALAESGGDPGVIGDIDVPVPGSASYGLWQINSHYHPEFGPDFNLLLDPTVNASAAFSVYQAAGNRFTPWTTFKSGAYAAFLDQINREA
jgi:lysozyme-like protein